MSTTVLASVTDGVATISLNRPEKRNAIDLPTLRALDEAVGRLGHDPAVRVMVLRGEGAVFSAGIDLGALATLGAGEERGRGVGFRRTVAGIQAVFNRIAALELPVIAALRGTCLGLGLELALAADMRVAEAGTRLGLPELLLGLVPDCGGTTRLSRLVGAPRAKRLIFTGEAIPAEEAAAIGLVDEVAPAGELDRTVGELTSRLARRPTLALGLAKRLVDAAQSMTPEQQMEMERIVQGLIVGAPDFGDNLQRGLAEMLTRKAERNRRS